MNNLTDYLTKLSDDIGREIDFDVFSQTLEESGWTSVMFNPFDINRRAEDIEKWAAVHCVGKWHNWRVKFVFERAEDATCAMLRWQ